VTQKLLNDRYRLDDELGQGGMGTVLRAFDTTLEREVAVKLVTGYEMETEGRARLLKEAKSIAQLNHPNIVTVYDAGEMDKSPYIVMELVEGSSLHEQPPDDLEALIRTAAQICLALEHAHERGIVHRDLKPENVLIDSEGSAKLMDFGIARSMTSRMTTEGRIEGTVFYMAPELALGQEYDGRADLYALGVMLYELTTGELPFQHGDPVAVISQHVHAPPVPPRAKDSEIPPGLDSLIVRLMEKDPDDRPSGATQVLEALQAQGLLDATGEEEQLSTLDRIVRGRMIGREAEFHQARELWSSAVDGNSQILLVSGEPGVGKTRLMREIITQSEVMGARVLGAASYAEGGPPYSPFKQILRDVLPRASQNGFNLPDDVVADLLSLAPEFRADYPEIAPNPAQDPKADQDRLFESFFVFVAALSRHTPLLIYLDDAHWADSGSLNLFRHLARQLGSQPILLLATYREIELHEARSLHEVLLDLSKEPQTTRLKLNRLTLDQTGDLLAAFFEDEITPEFKDGIYHETDGNPFFIEEVCKTLVESGKLYYEGGSWHRPDVSELGIPQSVQVAIQSRIGKLSPETQDVLDQAAILGREFEFDALALATEADEDSLIDALEEADRAQLIEERSENSRLTFAFSHALIPSTLIEGMRVLRRRRLHGRAATALLKYDPDNYATLGMHLIEAGKTDQGVDFLLLAGDQALSLFAHQEAIDDYLQALDYAKETEDNERAARTLMKLGLAYHSAFEFAESRQAYEQGFIYWQRASEGGEQGQISPAPHALRMATPIPATLDPGLAIDSLSISYIRQLFSGLVRATADLGVEPDIARSWDVLDDGRAYIFHLRDDVKWTDGRSVTAHDFEFAWKRVLDPATDSLITGLFLDIKGAAEFVDGRGSLQDLGVNAVEEYTLKVELENPTGYFLQLLDYPAFGPVPEHSVMENGSRWTDPEIIVTNGPYRLNSWTDGSGLTLVQTPSYHGRVGGNVAEVQVDFHKPGEGDLYRRYERNKFDIQDLLELTPEEHDRARHAHPDEYLTAPSDSLRYLAFDVRRPPFDDIRVRKAFCQAIDTESLAEIALRGSHSPATGGFVPPAIPGHMPDVALKYNPEAARQLLEESGAKGLADVVFLGSSDGIWPHIQDFLLTQWSEHLGVTIDYQQTDLANYHDQLHKHHQHIWIWAWSPDYFDPDSFLRMGLLSAMDIWDFPPYFELVEEARRTLDHSQRLEMYEQAQRLLVEEIPIFPILYSREHVLVKPWVRKFPLSPVGSIQLKDIVIEDHD
jgi:ABC-type oligopeptide transport system substrate-binding subunit